MCTGCLCRTVLLKMTVKLWRERSCNSRRNPQLDCTKRGQNERSTVGGALSHGQNVTTVNVCRHSHSFARIIRILCESWVDLCHRRTLIVQIAGTLDTMRSYSIDLFHSQSHHALTYYLVQWWLLNKKLRLDRTASGCPV